MIGANTNYDIKLGEFMHHIKVFRNKQLLIVFSVLIQL